MPNHDRGKRAKPYPAERARQGQIVLSSPTRRAIFIGGLVGVIVLALVVTILAGT